MRQDNMQDYAKLPDDVRLAYAKAVHRMKEEPVVKRKVSVALVLALIIVLLAGTAFAILSWHQHAEQIAQMEARQGYYDSWPADSRIALVNHLVEGGMLTADERTQRLLSGSLSDGEASRLATEIISDWGNIREDAISLMSILETVWGDYPNEWSAEDLAWYTQTLEANGEKPDTKFYVPEGGVLTKEQAIAKAIAYVKPLVRYSQEVWDSYTAAAVYESLAHTDSDDPYWHVWFIPSTRWTTRTYIPGVVIDPRTGEIYSDEEVLSPQELLDQYWGALESTDEYRFLRFKSHEERMKLQRVSRFGYGIPDPNCISEEEALAIAQKAFMEERGYTQEQLANLTAYAFFKPDNGGGRPIWTVGYYDEQYRFPDSYVVLSVDMLADTGKIYVYFPWED